VFGVSHGATGARERRRERRKKKNAQFLKVVERRYVLRMEPLVKEEDVEQGRQGQDPEQPYVLYSPESAVCASGFEHTGPLGEHDGDLDEGEREALTWVFLLSATTSLLCRRRVAQGLLLPHYFVINTQPIPTLVLTLN
jgi:hypothetical protein